jgi:hypothetical protein
VIDVQRNEKAGVLALIPGIATPTGAWILVVLACHAVNQAGCGPWRRRVEKFQRAPRCAVYVYRLSRFPHPVADYPNELFPILDFTRALQSSANQAGIAPFRCISLGMSRESIDNILNNLDIIVGMDSAQSILKAINFSKGKKMTKSMPCIVCALVVGLNIAITHAEEAPAPTSPHTITGNLGFVSDYRFRRISQTAKRPAIQGGFDYAHASGIYACTWASNVSHYSYTDANME